MANDPLRLFAGFQTTETRARQYKRYAVETRQYLSNISGFDRRSRWSAGIVTCLGFSANCFSEANSSLVSLTLCRVKARVRRILIARNVVLDFQSFTRSPAHS